jgi:polysaccharide export outer membrane protein
MLAFAGVLSLAGCADYPNSGPHMGPLVSGDQDPDFPVDVIEPKPATIAQYSGPPVADLPATERIPAAARQYRIAPGDIIRVTIFEAVDGTFKSLANGGSVFDQMRVDSDGDITIPFVHPIGARGANAPIKAAGLTRQGLRDEIVRDLEGKANQPQVVVDLLNNNDSVEVSGDVKTPGAFSLLDGPQTVLDAINKAGGPNQPPLQSEVIVRRKKSVTRMTMTDLMLHGGDSQVEAGDDIVVENHPPVFFVMGAVKAQTDNANLSTAIPFPVAHPTLTDAVGAFGGLLDNQADRSAIYLFRDYGLLGKPVSGSPRKLFLFDFSKPSTVFLARHFAVESNDIIYVANAPLFQAGKILSIVTGAGGLASSGQTLNGK